MATSVIKYIGRKTDFRGKTLWEIVGDLKNYGVGRLVIRNMFQRYPEPCYYKILKVQPVDHQDPDSARKVKVTVEKTWRGITLPKPIEIFGTSYKADYKLVDKEDEHKFFKNTKKVEERILSNEVELPPLLREFVAEETGEENPMIRVHFKKNGNKFVRLANVGENPTIQMIMGLGRPAAISEKLYEGVI